MDLQNIIDDIPTVIEHITLVEKKKQEREDRIIKIIMEYIKEKIDEAINNYEYKIIIPLNDLLKYEKTDEFKYISEQSKQNFHNSVDAFKKNIKYKPSKTIPEIISNILKNKGYEIKIENLYDNNIDICMYIDESIINDYNNYKPGESGYDESKLEFEQLLEL